MSGAVMNKILDFLGMETAEEEEIDEADNEYTYDYLNSTEKMMKLTIVFVYFLLEDLFKWQEKK